MMATEGVRDPPPLGKIVTQRGFAIAFGILLAILAPSVTLRVLGIAWAVLGVVSLIHDLYERKKGPSLTKDEPL